MRVITALISKIISAKTRKYKTNLFFQIHERVVTAQINVKKFSFTRVKLHGRVVMAQI